METVMIVYESTLDYSGDVVELKEEYGTVTEDDDDDTNVDTEKELSLEQKLELAITKKISTNQNTIHISAISKTIR
ncbi:hypothetical protein TNCV_183331 [Trichonephila clavipes]|nr:hypothetical protein TNCV_183331 [Trichonephila clavipes]